MKKIITILLIILNILTSHCQTYKELIQKADSSYNGKKYITSKEYFEKAFKLEQKNPNHLYNGACSASLSNDTKKAFHWLNSSIDNGYVNLNHLRKDSDLDALHSKKGWNKLTSKLEQKVALIEANYDKPLQKELLSIFEEDQNIRKEFMLIYKEYGSGSKKVDSIGKIMNYKDSLNLIKVIRILEDRGWVSKEIVGAQANQTLFLVVQHSAIKTQLKYLPMMRDAVKKGNAQAGSLALLEDRIALREGRKQIYGSQVSLNPTTKKYYISPLEDPDNVDKRRAEVGLGPLADYVKNWDVLWNVETYKKELPELEKLEKTKK